MAQYTILLIDYEPRSIERFREPLVGAGYGIEIATDGVSGIEAFHRLNPDMVLVEAMIPKKHGFEVCQELKRTPHGRKTPVIITTGVYKGRKYRTQALHIYGCDEYIEKPIAAEHLLEIVGRFLKPGPSGSPPKSSQSGSTPSESGGGSGSTQETSGSVAKPVTSAVSRTIVGPTAVPTYAPLALADDETEDEIMARLDEILPGVELVTPEVVPTSGAALAAALAEISPDVESDPFAEMRAELNAELGALPEPLEFEPTAPPDPLAEFMPSDEVVTPSVLEALPVPEKEIPIPPLPEAPPILTAERPGQVVDFDTKRSRKNKKPSKQNKDRGTQSMPSARPIPVASIPSASDAGAHRALDPVASVTELSLPKGTFVESQLEAPVARRGMPVWVWAFAGIVAVVGLYFVFSRDLPDRSVASSDTVPAPRSTPKETAPVEPPPAPPAADTSTPGVETPAPEPVVASAPAPLPAAPLKKPVERQPVKSVARDETKTPAPGPTASGSTAHAAAVSHTRSVTRGAPATAPQAPVAPAGLGDSDAGVETLPDPTVSSAPPSAPASGALIPIDEADTMPVSLSRRLPVYSEQARQMRLTGAVVLNVLVNEKGAVDQVVLVVGVPGADLNESAIRAAKAWTYRPATKNGTPVKVWKSEQIVFKR